MNKSRLGLTSALIQWLPDTDTPAFEYSSTQNSWWQRVSLPDDIAAGAIDLMKLNFGTCLSWRVRRLHCKQYQKLTPLAHVITDVSGPAVVVQCAHAGCITVADDHTDTEQFLESYMALFQHVDYVSFKLFVDPAAEVHATTFVFSTTELTALLGNDVAHTLLSAANIDHRPSTCILPIMQHLSREPQDSLPEDVDEDMYKLFIQVKALEYLCLLAVQVTNDAVTSIRSQREIQIRKIYRELCMHRGKLPPLPELAKRYGMSTKTLRCHFRRTFGQPIGPFLLAQRLNEAHVALQRTDIPMKVLAARCGYSHVNNFINAFKRKFGYAPGSLRRPGSRSRPRRATAYEEHTKRAEPGD